MCGIWDVQTHTYLRNNLYDEILLATIVIFISHWQVLLMDLVPDDKAAGLQTPVWTEYKQIINAAEEREVSEHSNRLMVLQSLSSVYI